MVCKASRLVGVSAMRMKRILITGAEGQLGRELVERFMLDSFETMPAGRGDLDVTNSEQTHAVVEAFRPHVIIHAAAYTQVDQAERDTDEAYRVNAIGTRNIAAAAERYAAKLVYLSTDYVFDGSSGRPYTEYDATSPINCYGASKLAGEHYVQQLCRQHFIVRTAWLYGASGHSFIKRIIEAAMRGEPIRAAVDEVGSPTYAGDLASFIKTLVSTYDFGIYHGVNRGSCSRYELVKAILHAMPGKEVKLIPARASEFGMAAQRPRNSALEGFAVRLSGLESMRPWEEAVQEFVQKLDVRKGG